QVADALVRVVRSAAHDADDLVPLGEQQFGEIGAVLAGDAGDQGGPAGLLGRAGRLRFWRPALLGGATMLGAHLLCETDPWRACARSVARAPLRGTALATRTTRPTAAGTPTCSASVRW